MIPILCNKIHSMIKKIRHLLDEPAGKTLTPNLNPGATKASQPTGAAWSWTRMEKLAKDDFILCSKCHSNEGAVLLLNTCSKKWAKQWFQFCGVWTWHKKWNTINLCCWLHFLIAFGPLPSLPSSLNHLSLFDRLHGLCLHFLIALIAFAFTAFFMAGWAAGATCAAALVLWPWAFGSQQLPFPNSWSQFWFDRIHVCLLFGHEHHGNFWFQALMCSNWWLASSLVDELCSRRPTNHWTDLVNGWNNTWRIGSDKQCNLHCEWGFLRGWLGEQTKSNTHVNKKNCDETQPTDAQCTHKPPHVLQQSKTPLKHSPTKPLPQKTHNLNSMLQSWTQRIDWQLPWWWHPTWCKQTTCHQRRKTILQRHKLTPHLLFGHGQSNTFSTDRLKPQPVSASTATLPSTGSSCGYLRCCINGNLITMTIVVDHHPHYHIMIIIAFAQIWDPFRRVLTPIWGHGDPKS